ncbi:TPA: hypothetical protein ACN5NM_003642 [Klebsiella aerogenes]|uniref:Uncharacterized protein n=1 Tax=Klebsiella aerogenes TaxID=548 RepID=A0AAW9E501_KLEAE|nr:hypothetical protein [Klebsiella aerogenes]MDX6775168.1 hypothetical protein [Klebsiella aerogenes]MDX7015961.1 hypothetical protein [Klebsiella aerogenes]RSW78142.1 hypothetical protein EGH63_11760 [Klebsiella aerogenes]UWA57468.1 hypothetical protein M5T48_10465 [Klebsiella aerogenes]HBV5500438.1 hypothetical protein [Klebsiella aerogenes]
MNNELTAALLTIEKCRELTNCPAGVDLQDWVKQLAAENVALKSNLMFWDADNPELPYDSPEEIASECSLNYNEEFVVQVAAKLPNRTYRVCESWESDCKLELVEGADLKTPATDRIVAGIKADGVEEFAESQKEYVRQHRNEMDQMLRAAYAGSAVDAERFAKQLREGAK